jgi:hypothetical protein
VAMGVLAYLIMRTAGAGGPSQTIETPTGATIVM